MKIWMMNHYATLMLQNKAGRHYSFAKELEKRGHEVTVFCSASSSTEADDIKFTGTEKWIEKKDGKSTFVFVKNTAYKANGLDRIKNMVSFYRNLFPVTKQYAKKYSKPEIIIASSVHPLTMVAGIQIAKKMAIPCICEIRDLWPEAIFSFGQAKENSLIGKVLVAGEHWIYKHADALIFTKEGDTDYLKEMGWTTEQGGDVDLSKCYYINNGVDLPSYDERIETEILHDPDLEDGSKFNVLYVGSIRPVNNVGNMLDAAAIIQKKEDCGSIQFLIYGDGSELNKLKERVQTESISNVKLKGRIPKQNIPYVLSKSGVNILNYSQTEYNWSRGNSSNKLFEYMASGKPIISTVRMGYSIINKYSCGVELDECTPECLADAIVTFYKMNDEERRSIGSNARAGAQDFYFVALTDKLEIVIESVT